MGKNRNKNRINDGSPIKARKTNVSDQPTSPVTEALASIGRLKFADVKYYLAFAFLLTGLILIKSQEESFSVGSGVKFAGGENYYDRLGIPRGSPPAEIKRAYKKLAVQLHPDKNKDCAECPARFDSIQVAYETLNSPERRRVYDKNSGFYEPINSDVSTSIHSSNSDILSSDELWVVQVYSDTDATCRSFAPFWEAVAQDMNHSLKFGRINADSDKDLLALLPVKVRAYPTILLLTKETYPLIFPLSDLSKNAFKNWIESEIPNLFGVITGSKPLVTLETLGGVANFEQKLVAFNWRNVFEFAIEKSSKNQFVLETGETSWNASADVALAELSSNFQVDFTFDNFERLCKGRYCFGFSTDNGSQQRNVVNSQRLNAKCMFDELGGAWVYDWDKELVAKNLRVENAQEILNGDDPEAVEDLFFKPYPRSQFKICARSKSDWVGRVRKGLIVVGLVGLVWMIKETMGAAVAIAFAAVIATWKYFAA